MTPFEAFAVRKEAEARRATLAPWTTEVDRHGSDHEPIGNAWTGQFFDGPFYLSTPLADLPATSLVFVQSRNGNTGAADPSSLGGGNTDKHLIYEGLSRVAADAVLAGAQTIRGGDVVFSVWHPELVALRRSIGLPRHPIQIVATLQGLDLVHGLLFNIPELHVIIVTVPSCDRVLHRAVEARPWIDTVVVRNPGDLRNALRQLRQIGVGRLSCVGGRTLARQLIDRRLVNDLYLTTTAREGGEPGTPLTPTPVDGRLVVRKRGTGSDAGLIFEHKVLTTAA